MSQIKKKYIAPNAVDGSKIRLDNDQAIRARSSDNLSDVEILKVNDQDLIEFASRPYVAGDQLVTQQEVQAQIESHGGVYSVKVAATDNVNIANPQSNYDEVTVNPGDTILLTYQTNAVENGVYVFNGLGNALTRHPDFADGNFLSDGGDAKEFFTYDFNGKRLGHVKWTTAGGGILGTDQVFIAITGFWDKGVPYDLELQNGNGIVSKNTSNITKNIARLNGDDINIGQNDTGLIAEGNYVQLASTGDMYLFAFEANRKITLETTEVRIKDTSRLSADAGFVLTLTDPSTGQIQYRPTGPYRVRTLLTSEIDINQPAPDVVDGITLTGGDEVFVNGQSNQIENGIYVYNGTGNNFTRANGAPEGLPFRAGQEIYVMDPGGTNYGRTRWTIVNDGVVGSNNLFVVQTSGSGGGGSFDPSAMTQSLVFADGVGGELRTEDVASTSQNLNVHTGNSSGGATGTLILSTGVPGEDFSSGSVNIFTSAVASTSNGATSGSISLITGDADNVSAGSTIGGITLQTGAGVGGSVASGPININTGAGSGSSGSLVLSTGVANNGSESSGFAVMYTGDANGSTGAVNIYTGSSGADQSGALQIYTGGADSNSGNVELYSGSSSNGQSGDLLIRTGSALNSNSGGISLQTGSANSTDSQGFIHLIAPRVNVNHVLNMGPQIEDPTDLTPTEGDLYYNNVDKALRLYDGTDWTTVGSGGGGGATTALDNLANTAINAPLIPVDTSQDLGTIEKYWQNAFINTLNTQTIYSETSVLNLRNLNTSSYIIDTDPTNPNEITFTDIAILIPAGRPFQIIGVNGGSVAPTGLVFNTTYYSSGPVGTGLGNDSIQALDAPGGNVVPFTDVGAGNTRVRFQLVAAQPVVVEASEMLVNTNMIVGRTNSIYFQPEDATIGNKGGIIWGPESPATITQPSASITGERTSGTGSAYDIVFRTTDDNGTTPPVEAMRINSQRNIIITGHVAPGGVSTFDFGTPGGMWRDVITQNVSSSNDLILRANTTTEVLRLTQAGALLFSGHVAPTANNTYDLGTSGGIFRDVFASGLKSNTQLDIQGGAGVVNIHSTQTNLATDINIATNFGLTMDTSIGTGSINILVGSVANGAATAGSVNITGGASTDGAAGDINLAPGLAQGTGTDGKIRFTNSGEGTIGHVWTSTGTGGEGAWMPSAGGAAVESKMYVDAVSVFNVNVGMIDFTELDGVGLGAGMVFLVTGQSTATENGPWVYTSTGAPATRPVGFENGDVIKAGYQFAVHPSGNLYGRTLFTVNASYPSVSRIVGTDGIDITQSSSLAGSDVSNLTTPVQFATGIAGFIKTINDVTSAALTLASGDSTNGVSGALNIITGSAVGGISGDIGIHTGTSDSSQTGNITISSAPGTSGIAQLTGNMFFQSGIASDSGTSGAVTIGSGVCDVGGSGNVTISSGSGNGGAYTGSVEVTTGSTSSSGASGQLSVYTGGGGDSSGAIQIYTGGASVDSGSINIFTQTGGNNSGSILIQTGTAGSEDTRGVISLNAKRVDLSVSTVVKLPYTNAPALITYEDGDMYFDPDVQSLKVYTGGDFVNIGGSTGGGWEKFTYDYSQLASGGAVNTFTTDLSGRSAGVMLEMVIIRHTTAFSGGAISQVTLSVGLNGGTVDQYASAFDVSTTPSGTNAQISEVFIVPDFASAFTLSLTANSVGDTLDQLTDGQVEILIKTSNTNV